MCKKPLQIAHTKEQCKGFFSQHPYLSSSYFTPMNKREVGLNDLIHYLSGTASLELSYRIDRKLIYDTDFALELEEWLAFLRQYPSEEEGLAVIRGLLDAWNRNEGKDSYSANTIQGKKNQSGTPICA